MSFSIRKVRAVMKLKTRTMFSNFNTIISPLMAIIFVVVLKNVMPDFPEDGSGFNKASYLLTFGILFDLIMGGIMISCYTLAEEKEKNTLRVLMTSSVNSMEYFWGSMIPAFVLLMVTSIIIVPIAGVSFSLGYFIQYLVLCFVVVMTSILIGYIIGIFSKTQVQASMYTTPIALILVMLPMFRLLSDKMEKVANYVYPTIIVKFVDQANRYKMSMNDFFVLLIWFLVALVVFAYLFKKNGFDKE